MSRCKNGNSKKKSRFVCLKHQGMNFIGDGIQRKRQREFLHTKDLYCLQCGEITKNLELRYCDWSSEVEEMIPELHNQYYDENGKLREEYREDMCKAL